MTIFKRIFKSVLNRGPVLIILRSFWQNFTQKLMLLNCHTGDSQVARRALGNCDRSSSSPTTASSTASPTCTCTTTSRSSSKRSRAMKMRNKAARVPSRQSQPRCAKRNKFGNVWVFCKADSQTNQDKKSAVQKPKHCLTCSLLHPFKVTYMTSDVRQRTLVRQLGSVQQSFLSSQFAFQCTLLWKGKWV